MKKLNLKKMIGAALVATFASQASFAVTQALTIPQAVNVVSGFIANAGVLNIRDSATAQKELTTPANSKALIKIATKLDQVNKLAAGATIRGVTKAQALKLIGAQIAGLLSMDSASAEVRSSLHPQKQLALDTIKAMVYGDALNALDTWNQESIAGLISFLEVFLNKVNGGVAQNNIIDAFIQASEGLAAKKNMDLAAVLNAMKEKCKG